METSTLTKKGQIVIPSKIRKAFDLQSGDKISFVIHNNELIIKPVDKKYFEELRGVLNTKGKILKSLLKEKNKERCL
ncbi:MAG TPA: AbrB/MazE/SpoVT family DNA-binding domain-containing protein [bacterium]|nr:AbrB/MazE/SpoVT family DNA-binding domain-containing protein [bacterium]